MLLQAALKGDLTKAAHRAVPVSAEELARDAVACVAAGARAIHLHPRDAGGRERLDPQIVDAVVGEVQVTCGVPVGVSTGAWIEPDLDRRLAMVGGWRRPDYASVNVSESGAAEIALALIDVGVGVEAGVWTVEDVDRLATWPARDRLTRILVEPVDASPTGAVALVDAIHAALDRAGLDAPRLQHGDGAATWILLDDAVRRGMDTRVGLEDALCEPSGGRTSGNAALVGVAAASGAGEATSPRPPSS